MFGVFATLAPVLAQTTGDKKTTSDHSEITADKNWDLETFFKSATKYTQEVGGAFLALIGIAGLVWGGFLGVRKLMGGQQAQQDSWFKIVALIIVGGAMLFGGMALLLNFAAGGRSTIENFGNGEAKTSVIVDQFAQSAVDGAVIFSNGLADVGAALPALL